MGTNKDIDRRQPEIQPVYIVVEGEGVAPHPDLSDIARALLRGWRLIVGCMALALVLVIGARHFMDTPYQSAAILSANPFSLENANSRSLGSAAGAAASLLGVGNITQNTTDFDRFIQALQSVRVAQYLIDKHHVERVLFDERWDAQLQQWVVPKESFVKTILRWLLVMPSRKPDADAVARQLKDIMAIDKLDDASPFQRVTLKAKTSQIAASLLSQLLKSADDVVRADNLARTSAYQAYLINRLQDSSVPALEREALTSRVSELDQKMMLVSTKLPFAMVINDGPYIARQPVSIPIVLLVTLVAGFILGCVAVFFVNIFPSGDGQVSAWLGGLTIVGSRRVTR